MDVSSRIRVGVSHTSLALGLLVLPGIAQAQSTASAESQASAQASAIARGDAQPSEDESDIIVTGIRGSLRSSIDAKRQSSQIVDAITAEDIGQFPDQNVTEAIQRINGVTITRDEGQGQQVNVRGFSPTFTRVEVNGRALGSATTAGGDTTRSPVLTSYSADIFRDIQVVKTPTARDVEGGLGGIVRLNTPKPLDIGKASFGGELSGSYVPGQEQRSGKLFAYGNAILMDGKLGVYITAAADFEKYPADTHFGNGVRNVEGDQLASPTAALLATLIQRRFWYRHVESDRRRFNVGAGIQFRPSDTLEISADVLYADYKRDDTNYEIRAFPSRGLLTNIVRDPAANLVVVADVSNVEWEVGTERKIRQQKDLGSSLNIRFTPERWKIEAVLSYQGLRAPESRDEAQGLTEGNFSFDVRTASEIPAISPKFDVANAALWEIDMLRTWRRYDRDEEMVGRLDVTREFDGFLRGLSAGGRYSDRDKFRRFQQARVDPNLFVSAVAGTFPEGEIYHGYVGSSFPQRWAAIDLDKAASYFVPESTLDYGRSLDGFDLGERVAAGYAMADFGWDGPVGGRANIGVRYIDTQFTARGRASTPAGFVDTFTQVDRGQWLPSANVSFNLAHDMQFRLAVSKVVTRPEIIDLNPNVTIDEDDDTGEIVATVGNPNLQPFTAWQYDASFEWYFTPESLLSVGLFYKDAKNFTDRFRFTTTGGAIGIQDPALINQSIIVDTRVNGGDGRILGLELGLQTPFTFLPAPFDGFGTILNYTRLDSKRTNRLGEEIPVEGLSKDTINIVGYYERGGFSTRLAYNYRSGFLNNSFGPGDPTDNAGNRINREFGSATGRLDYSLRYTFKNGLRLSFDAANLTNQTPYTYQDTELVSRVSLLDGRRFTFGIGVNF